MFFKLTKSKIENVVKKIIIENFDLPLKVEDVINEGIIEEYGLSSMDIYKTFIVLEKKFNIQFEDSAINIELFNSLDKLVDIIYKLKLTK